MKSGHYWRRIVIKEKIPIISRKITAIPTKAGARSRTSSSAGLYCMVRDVVMVIGSPPVSVASDAIE